jgi:tetratricopeptide (TPR) repeat protein
MMKHNFAIGVGLALAVVLPTAALGKQAPETLQQALDRTLAALEQLAGIEQRLAKHDASAVREAIAWTEPGIAVPADQPQARDEQLDALRHEVVALQGALDGDTRTNAPAATAKSPNSPQPSSATAATTGLDDATRRALGAPNSPRSGARDGAQDALPAAKRTFEPSGYSADPLELGRALYRREKFAAALVQFESQGTNIEATYWKARCLEHLNQSSDAIAAYNQVIASPAAGELVKRAKDDLEFLQWRLAIERANKPAPVKEQP